MSVYFLGSRPPRAVLAPTGCSVGPNWRTIEPDARQEGRLVRELQRLRPDDLAALAKFASTWGFLGKLSYEDNTTFVDKSGEPVRERALPGVSGPLIAFEYVDEVQEQVAAYHACLAAVAELPKLPVARRQAADRQLRACVAERLTYFGASKIDDHTLAWKVGSPLALAWMGLRDALLGGRRPRLCKLCRRPFTPSATDRQALTIPPRFCSETCRSNAAHRRLRRGGEKRHPGRYKGKRPRKKA